MASLAVLPDPKSLARWTLDRVKAWPASNAVDRKIKAVNIEQITRFLEGPDG